MPADVALLDSDESVNYEGRQEQADSRFFKAFVPKYAVDYPSDSAGHHDMADLGDDIHAGPGEDEHSAQAEECQGGDGHCLDHFIFSDISQEE